jgi:NAD+ kinase
MPIRTVGITSKPNKIDVGEIVPPLIHWLRERQIDVIIDTETGATLHHSLPSVPRAELVGAVDLLIVLGGDGTLLATARTLTRAPIPILAVNVGGLGFLTVITRDELYSALERVLEGNFRTECRVRIDAEVIRAGERISSFLALNDVVLNKAAIARVLDFELAIDGEFISTYKADGLIVSTPTGSTAYSLAAGGPVVAPTVQAFLVTPICAHTLSNRPIVLPDTAQIEVRVTSQEESVFLTVDGQVGIAVRSGDCVCMKKAAAPIEIIRPSNKSYFEILRAKLKWGER